MEAPDMGDIFTATGSKFYIGPSVTNGTDTAAEFAALAWVEVGLIETLGEYGDESSPVTFAAIGDGRTRKAKGSRDAGMMAVTVGRDATDVGQQALAAAERTYNNYAFKVVLPNRLTVSGTDEINYFRGLVMSRKKNVGGNDNVVRDTYNIGVNSELVEVAPTAGP
jgi:hypothetical protein